MAKKKSEPIDLSLADTLRDTITRSDQTMYAVAKGSGVPYPTVHRFMAGERDLTLETADKLCKFFKLKLTKDVDARE